MRDGYRGPLGGAPLFQGLSLHYYTVPGTWEKKHAASPFDHAGWKTVMALGWKMEELVRRHREVMDRFDPTAATALVVDEWGSWYAPEPGTNPGLPLPAADGARRGARGAQPQHLHQPLRAGAHRQPRADRERPAGRRAHRGGWGPARAHADLARASRSTPRTRGRSASRVETKTATLQHDGRDYPGVSATASLGADGAVNVTLCNTDSEHAAELELALPGRTLTAPTAQVIARAGADHVQHLRPAARRDRQATRRRPPPGLDRPRHAAARRRRRLPVRGLIEPQTADGFTTKYTKHTKGEMLPRSRKLPPDRSATRSASRAVAHLGSRALSKVAYRVIPSPGFLFVYLVCFVVTPPPRIHDFSHLLGPAEDPL